jgi:hypothetical protein
MTRRGKFIFGGCVLGHTIVSWFTAAWCVGVSMAILDSGGTEAPLSLSVMCLVHVVTRYPLKPLTDLMSGAAAPVQPAYWPPLLLNSLVAVSIIFLVVRGLRRLLRSGHAKLAHEKT